MKTAQVIILLAILVLLQSCYKEPIANFTYTYKESMAPANVTFENLSTEADKFIWDFGDGSSSNEKAPVHEYYSFVKPVVSMQASGRGGENAISQTLGITSYYVKNSSNVSLYKVKTYFWDESLEKVVDDFELGFLGPGTDSDVVITNHAVIDLALELSDGTLYLVKYSYNLNIDALSYLNITDETDIVEVGAKKKGSMLQFDPWSVRESGTSITIGDLALQ